MKKGRSIWANLGILLIIFILKKFLIADITFTLCNAVFFNRTVSSVVTVILSNAVCALIAVLPCYIQLKNDSEERRDVIQYFADIPFTKKSAASYIFSSKQVRVNLLTYGIAIFLFVMYEYLLSAIVVTPLYFAFAGAEFVIFYGIYLLWEYFGRMHFYKLWDGERLHGTVPHSES